MMTLMSGILDGPPHGMILTLLLWLTPSEKAEPVASKPAVAQQRIPAAVVNRAPALPPGKSRRTGP
jgi:hypothetical protein